MPSLDPRIIELREATITAVDQLLSTGRYRSEADALRYFRRLALQRRAVTGFNLKTFDSFHEAYRNWKRSPTRDQKTQKNTDENFGISSYMNEL